MNPITVLFQENKNNPQETFKKILRQSSWDLRTTHNPVETLNALEKLSKAIIFVDVDHPQSCGTSLISQIQSNVRLKAKIIVFTSYSFEQMHQRIRTLGVSDIFTLPINYNLLGRRMLELKNELSREDPASTETINPANDAKPPFIGISIAVSTGGPQTLETLFGGWGLPPQAAIFVVQHGPAWALKSIAKSLNEKCGLTIEMAEHQMEPSPGMAYLAPGDHHLEIDPGTYKLQLTQTPPENFLRPAADPLFRSMAKTFGKFSIGVVLSGMGSDGTSGAKNIKNSGGMIIVQDPKSCISPFMPQSVIKSEIPHTLASIDLMGKVISIGVEKLERFRVI